MKTFDSFQEAYVEGLRQVAGEPDFRNAPRGFESREVLSHSFRLLNPTNRYVGLKVRRSNIVFNFAEALWYLSGSNDLEHIAYYAPRMRTYSSDGRTLDGTAYGPRIFGSSGSSVAQWDRLYSTLVDDPDSKRGVVAIYESRETGAPRAQDVACTLALQFFIRENSLHAVAYMRANDAYTGVVSDVFSFTLLQELLAKRLGVRNGSYTHFAGSYHMYERDSEAVHNLLAVADQDRSDTRNFPFMPEGDPTDSVQSVLRWERLLRSNEARLDKESILDLQLEKYWRDIVALFELYRQVAWERRVNRAILDELPGLYRDMFVNRWSTYISDMS